MCAFLAYGEDFSHDIFSFTPVVRALYMVPHHAQLSGPIFVLFPPCVSLRGGLGVCIFQQSQLLEFECSQLKLEVSSDRNLHLPICSQLTKDFSFGINRSTIIYFAFKLIQNFFTLYALSIILIILIQLEYLSPIEIQRFIPFHLGLMFKKTVRIEITQFSYTKES